MGSARLNDRSHTCELSRVNVDLFKTTHLFSSGHVDTGAFFAKGRFSDRGAEELTKSIHR